MTSNGTPDNTFGLSGKIITAVQDSEDFPLAIALQADNRIVIAGNSYHSGHTEMALARFLQFPAGVNNIKFANEEVILYPSPAKTKLFISGRYQAHVTGYSATDMYGRSVLIQYRSSKEISTSHLKDGVYLFHLNFDNAPDELIKIIIQN